MSTMSNRGSFFMRNPKREATQRRAARHLVVVAVAVRKTAATTSGDAWL